jgi:GT2 family glycosyltransferase
MEPHMTHSHRFAVSVVVPTRGRPSLLACCLDALSRQTLAPDRYEIIIVDDGPSADTRAVVEDYAARMSERGLSIHYVPSYGPHGPAAARNRGWRRALAQVIAFTDDDTQPDRGWLEAGLRAFQPEIQAVSGSIVMPLPDSPTDYELDASGLTRSEFVTANCFCRRSALERLGGFDERFLMAWREDSDFHFRLLRSGARVVKADDAIVVHPVRPAGWGISLRQQKKIMFDALLYRKHPGYYRARVRKSARWDYHIAVLALLTIPLAMAVSMPALALGAAAVWGAITLTLCAKRLRHTSRRFSHVIEMLFTSAVIPPVAVFWRLVGSIKYRAWLA